MASSLRERSPVLRFFCEVHQHGWKATLKSRLTFAHRSCKRWKATLAARATLALCAAAGLLKWFFSWRTQGRFWVGAMSLATLVVLFYTVENWRGHRAWERYREAAEATGQSFNYLDYVPPAVPDAENLAMAPIFRPVLEYDRVANQIEWHDPPGFARVTGINPRWRLGGRVAPSVGDWLKGEVCDLEEWQFYYRGTTHLPAGVVPEAWLKKYASLIREQGEGSILSWESFPIASEPQSPAEDVLLALSLFDTELDEVTEAGRRPWARWPVRYQDGFVALLPHLAAINGITEVLRLRAIAYLHQGNPDRAAEDLALCWRLTESIESEPLYVSAVIRQERFRESLQILWEGQQLRIWQEPQLRQFGHQLSQFEFKEQDVRAQRMERAIACHMFLSMRQWVQDGGWHLRYRHDRMIEWWLRLAPRAWVYHNIIAWDQMLKTVSFHTGLVGLPAETVLWSDLPLLPRRLTLVPAQYLASSEFQVGPVPRSERLDLALTKASLRLAQTACALELYRLSHGDYPESLALLIPDFLPEPPSDPMAEGPLRYRQPAPGQFILYSVGANGVDDGGVSATNLREGDWVWHNDAPAP